MLNYLDFFLNLLQKCSKGIVQVNSDVVSRWKVCLGCRGSHRNKAVLK